MGLPFKYGFCIACNDKKTKPCIGKRENALCIRHYWRAHKQSAAKKAADRGYYRLRKDFLGLYPECQLKMVPECTMAATEIHHTKGTGEYYLNTSTWKGSCRNCHRHAEDHPGEAYEQGVSLKRLEQ